MRLRNIPEAEPAIQASEHVIKNPENHRGSWKEIFGNDNEIHIEIGMGKGKFIIEMALLHPDINYIGIEKFTSVLYRAIQKMDSMENVPSNLKFINVDAEDITKYFESEEIGRIYLNFSDPWPKDRHAKRRLESRRFLGLYEQILKEDGLIEFKTDNVVLFDFALEELEVAEWELLEMTRDLHKDERLMEGNVMTEYERKFSTLGNKIYKYIIRKKR